MGALLLGLLLGAASPLSDLIPEPSHPFFEEWRPARNNPEPLETARYLLAIAMPVALALLVIALGRPGPRHPLLDPGIVLVQLAFGALLVYAISREKVNPNFDFFQFQPYLLPRASYLVAVAVGALLTALALSWEHHRLAAVRRALQRVQGLPGAIAFALAAVLTAIWLLPGVITEQNVATNGLIPLGHIPIEFDEFVAASNGLTPLVDFVPWYSSLLPTLLGWWWPWFDSSVTAFTTTMVVLSAVALVAVYAAFRELTGSAWRALALFAPFLAMSLQPWHVDGAVRQFLGNYYAVMPERYLGPFLVLWLLARYLRRGSPPVWVIFGVAGLAAINSADFGIASVLALAIGLSLWAWAGPDGVGWLRRAAPQAIAGLLLAAIVAIAVILIASGELPHPDLFAYPSRLTRNGYTAASMPLWGVHWALYLTYAAALACAAVRCATRSPDRTLTGLLAFAGAFGLLTGAYFAARSLQWQLWSLFPAWAIALALLALAGWRALRAAPRGAATAPLLPAAAAAMCGFGLMVASIGRLPAPWDQVDRIRTAGVERYDATQVREFIEGRTDPGEPVLIIGWVLPHRVAEQAGVRNVFPFFGVQALLGPREMDRAVDALEDAGGSRVFLNVAIRENVVPSDEILTGRLETELRSRGFLEVGRQPATGVTAWRTADALQPEASRR